LLAEITAITYTYFYTATSDNIKQSCYYYQWYKNINTKPNEGQVKNSGVVQTAGCLSLLFLFVISFLNYFSVH